MLGACASNQNGLFPAMFKIKGAHFSNGSRRRDATEDRGIKGARPKDCALRRGQRGILDIQASPASHDVMRRLLDQDHPS